MSDLAVGDIVETIKGASFWGRIIALDDDVASPGCTVLAIAPGFEGTKHVYPVKQLQRRVCHPTHRHKKRGSDFEDGRFEVVSPSGLSEVDLQIAAGAEVRRRNRVGAPEEKGSISPSCEQAAMMLVVNAFHACGLEIVRKGQISEARHG